MLHAIKAGDTIIDPDGGKEAWAFMPSLVLPNLYKLARARPMPPNTCIRWMERRWSGMYTTRIRRRTVLVSGMNKGGKGYFALDVTNPAAPVALWEFKNVDAGNCVTVDATTKAPATDQFSDCHIGYTFNNPIITKLRA